MFRVTPFCFVAFKIEAITNHNAMRKELMLSLACVSPTMTLQAQELENTQWETTWGNPIGEVCLTFGSDTLHVTTGTGLEVAIAIYSEENGILTINDLYGAYACPTSQTGTYNFEITGNGTTLSLYAIDDECVGRRADLTNGAFTRKQPTDTSEPSGSEFIIFPNPAQHSVQIIAKGHHGLVVYDALGRNVGQYVFANQLELDTSDYPRGSYTIKLDKVTTTLVLE